MVELVFTSYFFHKFL